MTTTGWAAVVLFTSAMALVIDYDTLSVILGACAAISLVCGIFFLVRDRNRRKIR